MAYNILLVDDSAITRAAIKRTISMADVDTGTIFEAENGKIALEVLEKEWVDLVVSDLNMPEMNGIEMTKQIQADEQTQSIPVVIVTTESSTTRVDELTNLGIKGFVHKPFTPEQIRDVIHEALGVPDE